MGYFDGLTDGCFKRGRQGQMVFFPWGKFGCGYAIPTEEQYQAIRGFVKNYLMLSLPIIVLVGIIFGSLYSFVALVPLYIVYQDRVRTLTRELVKSSERLTFSESYKNQAASHNLVILWILEAMSLLVVLIGIVDIFLEIGNLFMIIAGITFFGLSSIAIGFMIRTKSSRADVKQLDTHEGFKIKNPEIPEGYKFSISEAAQAIGVTKGTLQDYVKSGRINANYDMTIDAAELLQAGFIIRTLPPRHG